MIDPTDPEYDDIRTELVAAVGAARAAQAAAVEARRRRAEIVRRAQAFGLTLGDIAHIVGVSRQRAHNWADLDRPR